jgi:hypothetical protein
MMILATGPYKRCGCCADCCGREPKWCEAWREQLILEATREAGRGWREGRDYVAHWRNQVAAPVSQKEFQDWVEQHRAPIIRAEFKRLVSGIAV